MQYLLMLYLDETDWPKLTPPRRSRAGRLRRLYRGAAGSRRAEGRDGCNQLRTAPPSRLADGKPQVLDGPYADTQEQLGGCFVIEAPDRAAAIAWAERCPAVAHGGVVELRPLWDMG